MILYHGSNMVFWTPLLAKCSPHKDFGQGSIFQTPLTLPDELRAGRCRC